MRRVVSLGAVWILLVVGIGCSEELGPCDQHAAIELVYGRADMVATAGQALAHDSCGNGAFCHSSRATGASRVGVPFGFDFDMLPSPSGWLTLMDYREDAWAEVSSGSMPPRLQGPGVGDGQWFYGADRSEGGRRLPGLATAQGKEILRNWLACSAPTVEDTTVPPPGGDDVGDGGDGDGDGEPDVPDAGVGHGDGDGDGDGDGNPLGDADGDGDGDDAPPPPDWAPIYEDIVEPGCATLGCHDRRGASLAGKLDMSDECDAYDAMFEKGTCGTVRVVAGDPESFLLEKVSEAMPSCGVRMPVIGNLTMGQIDRIEAWIRAGAHSQRCE